MPADKGSRVFENVVGLTFTWSTEAPYAPYEAYMYYDSPRPTDRVPCNSALIEGEFTATWAHGSMGIDFKKPTKCSYDEAEKRVVCRTF